MQIHILHPYTDALVNRDDSGLSKRLPYGGTQRTRISSQCLKRHWRVVDDSHALNRIDADKTSYRSRELVTKLVIDPLRATFAKEIVDALEPEFQKAVYGNNADKGKQSRQTLLFGKPETDWLAAEAAKLAAGAKDAAAAKAAAGEWAKTFKGNIKAMREGAELPGGLISALFGRMVTSDTSANIDAPIHVAHAFTVHPAEIESDYFTAVDDIKDDNDDSGADTIQETELASGLYYGFVVIDIPALIKNCANNSELAAKVVHNLIYLIGETSAGAKLGSTAPYSRAEFMMIESGDRQPRNLAGAYRKAVNHDLDAAVGALSAHLQQLDEIYETGETRRYFGLSNIVPPGAEPLSLKQMASWASAQVKAAMEQAAP
jgi:CRISPR system Cascade subunit CasC